MLGCHFKSNTQKYKEIMIDRRNDGIINKFVGQAGQTSEL
jgi:hypothetical protein